jgi:hypothetical protein
VCTEQTLQQLWFKFFTSLRGLSLGVLDEVRASWSLWMWVGWWGGVHRGGGGGGGLRSEAPHGHPETAACVAYLRATAPCKLIRLHRYSTNVCLLNHAIAPTCRPPIWPIEPCSFFHIFGCSAATIIPKRPNRSRPIATAGHLHSASFSWSGTTNRLPCAASFSNLEPEPSSCSSSSLPVYTSRANQPWHSSSVCSCPNACQAGCCCLPCSVSQLQARTWSDLHLRQACPLPHLGLRPVPSAHPSRHQVRHALRQVRM